MSREVASMPGWEGHAAMRSLSDERLGAQVRHSFLCSDREYETRRIWRDVLAFFLARRAASH